MNIVCDKTLLSAAIDGVSKAVTMRSAIPVLEGILLKAEGFQLTLTGYDIQLVLSTSAVESETSLHDSTIPPQPIHNPVETKTPAFRQGFSGFSTSSPPPTTVTTTSSIR